MQTHIIGFHTIRKDDSASVKLYKPFAVILFWYLMQCKILYLHLSHSINNLIYNLYDNKALQNENKPSDKVSEPIASYANPEKTSIIETYWGLLKNLSTDIKLN